MMDILFYVGEKISPIHDERMEQVLRDSGWFVIICELCNVSSYG